MIYRTAIAMRPDPRRADISPGSSQILDDVLRSLSASTTTTHVKEIAQEVGCSLTTAAKALSLLGWLGFVIFNENAAVLDPKVRELVVAEGCLRGY